MLDKAIELRKEIADLLGYATWADFITEEKMVKSAQNVKDVSHDAFASLPANSSHLIQFISDLEAKLRPVGLKDRDTLLKLKKEEHEKLGIPYDGELWFWDYRYYDRLYVERSLDLDDMLVKEYFPVSVVVPAILDIYQNLLGVQFQEVKGGEIWHPGQHR